MSPPKQQGKGTSHIKGVLVIPRGKLQHQYKDTMSDKGRSEYHQPIQMQQWQGFFMGTIKHQISIGAKRPKPTGHDTSNADILMQLYYQKLNDGDPQIHRKILLLVEITNQRSNLCLKTKQRIQQERYKPKKVDYVSNIAQQQGETNKQFVTQFRLAVIEVKDPIDNIIIITSRNT